MMETRSDVLVDATWLDAHLHDPAVRVVEVDVSRHAASYFLPAPGPRLQAGHAAVRDAIEPPGRTLLDVRSREECGAGLTA
jgi:hypothetical protein